MTNAPGPEAGEPSRPVPAGNEQLARYGVAALFALAALQYGWNAWFVTPLTGFDGPAHAGYMLTIVEEGRLPLPYEGWSTFHPPFYYLCAAVVWKLAEWAGPHALVLALRALSMAAMFAAVAVLWRMLVARGASAAVQVSAVALGLLLPVSQFAATWIGNEALGVALASLALPAIVALQRDAGDRRAALVAGFFVGLALATKYTGIFVAVACAVPFLRPAAWPAARRSLPWLAAAVLLVAGPVYARNLWLTGSPVPMTRDQGFHAQLEKRLTLRPRALGDFGVPSFEVLRRPSLFHVEGEPMPGTHWNESMQNVWGLAYTTIWYDGSGHRIKAEFHRDGVVWGPLLAGLGLLPTALLLLGFGGALRDAVRSRLAAPDAPLVAMSLAGVALFVAFTVRAPAIVAAKGSYLLPLLVPAGLFYARGMSALGGPWRLAAAGIAVAGALVAAGVFTSGLVFPEIPEERVLQSRAVLDRVYPDAHIGDGIDRVIGHRTR